MTVAYIALGSNMDSPEEQIEMAIQSLAKLELTSLLNVSSLYKSKPVGPQDQDDYINAVAQLETDLTALELLDNLQTIENEHDRVRNERWGPRTLDLDILMYGDEEIQNERLTIPHAEMLNRVFVLVPLAEISPACDIPSAGSIAKYLDHIDRDGLEILS